MVTGLLVAWIWLPWNLAYAGKQSGETWLLWQVLDQLKPGDTLVADCFHCTYWLVAACKNKGANIVMKNHHKREDNPLGARQLNQHESTTGGLKPQRRDWMSEQEYDAMPEQVEIRLVDIVINQAGLQ